MKYGFVYIWRDRKHGKYYIGSHWGTEDDGYICSSNWMRNSRNRRPDDFRRRVIAKVYTNRQDLLRLEFNWLALINKNELGKKYYNLRCWHQGHWAAADTSKQWTTRQKISNSIKGRKLTEEHRRAISNGNKGKTVSVEHREALRAANIGKKASAETREKQRQAKLGKLIGPFSEEHKRRISAAQKGIPRPYACRPISEEQKTQISAKARDRWALIAPELRTEVTAKMRAARRPAGSPVTDVFLKSRRRGDENGNSKLTADIVREIRASAGSQRSLAKKYSVSSTLISNIQKRKTWAHVIDGVDSQAAA